MGQHTVPALSTWCLWHVGTTQDLEDTVYSPHVKCGSQRKHWLFAAFSPGDWQTSAAVRPYCLQFTSWGSSPSPCSGYPTGSDQQKGLATLGCMQLRQTLAHWTSATRLPGERPLLEMNGDTLCTQQRSSGVRYEWRRRIRKPSIQLLCTSLFSGCHGRKTQLVLCFKHLAKQQVLVSEDFNVDSAHYKQLTSFARVLWKCNTDAVFETHWCKILSTATQLSH